MIIELFILGIYFMTILLAREDKIENLVEMNYRKNLGLGMLYLIYGTLY